MPLGYVQNTDPNPKLLWLLTQRYYRWKTNYLSLSRYLTLPQVSLGVSFFIADFESYFPSDKNFIWCINRLLKVDKLLLHSWWCWWIVYVVWLTHERRLALFPAGTIVRDPHHREPQTRHEYGLHLRRNWV